MAQSTLQPDSFQTPDDFLELMPVPTPIDWTPLIIGAAGEDKTDTYEWSMDFPKPLRLTQAVPSTPGFPQAGRALLSRLILGLRFNAALNCDNWSSPPFQGFSSVDLLFTVTPYLRKLDGTEAQLFAFNQSHPSASMNSNATMRILNTEGNLEWTGNLAFYSSESIAFFDSLADGHPTTFDRIRLALTIRGLIYDSFTQINSINLGTCLVNRLAILGPQEFHR